MIMPTRVEISNVTVMSHVNKCVRWEDICRSVCLLNGLIYLQNRLCLFLSMSSTFDVL